METQSKLNFMDEIVCHVYSTMDYDKFKIMGDGNRDIDHDENIANSMKEMFLFSPILVNEKMEIIDGQNRFVAAKSLNKPIFYMIKEGYGIDEVRILNSNSRNWQKKDFVKSYADEGKPEYVRFKQFQEMFPDFPTSVCEYILKLSSTDDASPTRSSRYASIKRGLLKIPNFEQSCAVARMIMAYKPFCQEQSSPIYRRKEFVSVIIKLSKCPDFDNNLVLQKIKLNPRSFVPCVNSREYLQMIEDIVNFRNRNKVRFNV